MSTNPAIMSHNGLAALKGSVAAICRHPYGGERSFVAFATHLGGGAFATITDGRLRLPWKDMAGLGRYSNLRVHILDGSGRTYWVEWVYETPVAPIAILQVRGHNIEKLPTPSIATIADMMRKNHVWRIGYADGIFGDQSLEVSELGTEPPPIIKSGWICSHPDWTFFRNEADEEFGGKSTIAGHVCFDYPNRSDLGGPVIDNEGRLVGVLVGADLGAEMRHVGSYVPMQFILPLLEAARADANYLRHMRKLHRVVHQEDEEEAATAA